MLEENSFKVLESVGDSPSFVNIAVNAVKDRLNANNVCCVQLQNGQYIIGAAEPNREDIHLFIPCNSPGAPSTISWTADYFVNEMLPHPSQCKILVNTICEKLHLNFDGSNARYVR
ncbi:unnamed protein product [Hymenolepis diminuta]|uniref:Uncharacterized protein n=1 Tax=Hymenolepis diminuta TaxID=6216 RepID=A0A564YR57_HYMDI|nr:unnamed protein product [Hymenolepis diminuta]